MIPPSIRTLLKKFIIFFLLTKFILSIADTLQQLSFINRYLLFTCYYQLFNWNVFVTGTLTASISVLVLLVQKQKANRYMIFCLYIYWFLLYIKLLASCYNFCKQRSKITSTLATSYFSYIMSFINRKWKTGRYVTIYWYICCLLWYIIREKKLRLA